MPRSPSDAPLAPPSPARRARGASAKAKTARRGGVNPSASRSRSVDSVVAAPERASRSPGRRIPAPPPRLSGSPARVEAPVPVPDAPRLPSPGAPRGSPSPGRRIGGHSPRPQGKRAPTPMPPHRVNFATHEEPFVPNERMSPLIDRPPRSALRRQNSPHRGSAEDGRRSATPITRQYDKGKGGGKPRRSQSPKGRGKHGSDSRRSPSPRKGGRHKGGK